MQQGVRTDCSPSQSKEQREIEREISQLRREIDKMEGLTMNIFGKLAPVLRDEPAGPDNSEKLSAETCTPLGAELRGLIKQVSGTSATQEEILNKLEL